MNLWPAAKSGLDRAGVGYPLRQAYVHARSVGERAVHLVYGRPGPESAVLVAGAGRSGTTWLGELLCHRARMQEIFEPLLPFWSEDVRTLTGWRADNPTFEMIYLRPHEAYAGWHSYLYRVLTGRVRNYWTDANRTCWFPTRYLVKEIRMNLMLGFIAHHFRPKIVFILRNPIDVVASRLALGWRVDLNDAFTQETLMADHLAPWMDQLRAVSDPVEQHAAWWAVENLVALRQLADYAHEVVVYEVLAEDPVRVTTALRNRLGIGGETDPTCAERPSRMAAKSGKNFRAALSDADVQKICRLCFKKELVELWPEETERWC